MQRQMLFDFERSARWQILDHQRDAFESLLDFNAAIAKLVLSANNTQIVLDRNLLLVNALKAEKEATSTLKVKLDVEHTRLQSTNRLGESAVAAVDYWRRKASELAQQVRELDEARGVAHEAALFWKARCVCATAAVKQLTAEEFD
jgi:hypothetical protein